jgi:hypothetical protein
MKSSIKGTVKIGHFLAKRFPLILLALLRSRLDRRVKLALSIIILRTTADTSTG